MRLRIIIISECTFMKKLKLCIENSIYLGGNRNRSSIFHSEIFCQIFSLTVIFFLFVYTFHYINPRVFTDLTIFGTFFGVFISMNIISIVFFVELSDKWKTKGELYYCCTYFKYYEMADIDKTQRLGRFYLALDAIASCASGGSADDGTGKQ